MPAPPATSASPPRPWLAAVVDGGVVAGCLAAYSWARRGQLQRGYSTDEISLYFGGTPEQVMADVLTAVQPPGLRVWLSLFSDPRMALDAGRVAAFTSLLLAVPLVYGVSRRLGASAAAAGLAALAVAIDPVGVEVSTQARVYAFLVPVLVVYVAALSAWVQRPRWRSGLLAAGAAALLPQLHYITAPWLALVGVGAAVVSRRPVAALALHVPAAVGFAVWLPAILGGTGAWEPPGGHGVLEMLHRTLPLTDRAPGTVVVLVALVALAARAGRPGQLLAMAVAGLAGTALAVGAQHYLTHQAGALGLALAPLAAARVAGPLRGPSPGARPAVRLVVLVGFALLVVSRHGRSRFVLAPASRDAVQTFAHDWPDRVPPGGEVAVVPTYTVQSVLFHVKFQTLAREPRIDACRGEQRCFVARGVRFVGREPTDLPDHRPLLVVHTGYHPLDAPPSDCLVDESELPLRLYRCGEGFESTAP